MSCIRPATPADAARIADIYNPFVLTTAISFEEAAVSVEDMAGRIRKVTEVALPWLVAEADGTIIGYAYATKWKERHAYRFTVEVSVYVVPEAGGHGVGSKLYAALFALLKSGGYHAAIGGIALPNAPSIALHEKFGMTKVAHFKEAGFKFGRWHDVGNWQVTL